MGAVIACKRGDSVDKIRIFSPSIDIMAARYLRLASCARTNTAKGTDLTPQYQ